MSNQPPTATPAAEFDIDANLIRGLLRDQHPDLAELTLEPMEPGWDNAMFRLGATLTVRLPRRAAAAILVDHEQRWLPELAPHLPLPIPAPLRVGQPGRGYPWSWSVLPWLPGEPADQAPPAPDQGAVLGEFLRVLHTLPVPLEAPRNPYRGVPLRQRADIVSDRLQRLKPQSDLVSAALLAIWQEALDARPATRVGWVHGDLHARNALVEHRAFSAIIDWGDVCAGDPATDLAAVWTLLDGSGARQAAIAAYPADQDTWRRARGWAVSFGSVLLETGLADHPRHARLGSATLRRLLDPG